MKKYPTFIVFCLLFSLTCSLSSAIQRSAETPSSSPIDTSPTLSSASLSEGPTNTDGAEVIYIPPTTFLMGASAGDSQAEEDERLAHQVSLNGFYIYAREVTNRMYSECVRAGACFPVQTLPNGPTSHHNDPAYADYPVVGVDWNMAREYCRWAGGRLPTEAEWELAARGAEGFQYPWGNEPTPACNLLNMFGCLVPPDTQRVGSYPDGVSPFGLFDMAGNVWEWVNDWYSADYYGASPASTPFGPSAPANPDQPYKVVRGGSWNSYPENVRATARTFANAYLPYDDLGFRCVAQPEAWPQELTLPEPGHAIPEWSGPDRVGARVGEEQSASMVLSGWQVTCPDPDGIVRIALRFSGEAQAFRVEGVLAGMGAETIACTYFPEDDGGWLLCAEEESQIYVNPQGNYELQLCLFNQKNNGLIGCTGWMQFPVPVCDEGGMEQCDVVCHPDGTVDLYCMTNRPDTIAWVEDEWEYVSEGSVILQNCQSTVAEQMATITCLGNVIQPIGDEYVFLFCSANTCNPMSVPVPADCIPAGSWSLVGYGCHDADTVFVTIDTGIPNVWDRLDDYDVQDNERSYTCSAVPNNAQRLYCYAPETASVSPITVCLTIDGVDRCQIFQRASGYLPCEEQQEPQPEEPQQPQPQPGDPCNQYTDPYTCKDHSLPPNGVIGIMPTTFAEVHNRKVSP